MSSTTPTTSLEVFLMEYILAINEPITINWANVLAGTGLRNEGSARNKMRAIKRSYQASTAAATATDDAAAAPQTSEMRKTTAGNGGVTKKAKTEKGDGEPTA